MSSVVAELGVLCGSAVPFGTGNHTIHCDQHFQKIREVFQVPDPDVILESNNLDLDAAEKGTGKSGAKMLFSTNKRYIVKSMSARDIQALMPVIHEYTMHILNHASTSLMMQFYALLQDAKGGFWVIANNWLPVKFPIVWDLKGSSSGRTSGERSGSQKDNDWRSAHRAIALSPSAREQVLQALESDSTALGSWNLIDYSLIIGVLVYDLQPCNGKGQPSCIAPVCHPTAGCGEAAYNLGDYYNTIRDYSCPNGQMRKPTLGQHCTSSLTKTLKINFACFGVIDLLKPFDAKSKAEYLVTGGIFGRKTSVRPAETYAQRFFDFMHERVFPPDASEGTVSLTMDASTCSAWGSRKQGEGGFPIYTVIGLVIAGAIAASFTAWYFMNQSPSAGEETPQDPSAIPPGYSEQTAYTGYDQSGYAGYAQQHPQGYAPQGYAPDYSQAYAAGYAQDPTGTAPPQQQWPAS